MSRSRKKSKRSHASYVRAGKKAARSRKRRGNPARKAHRVTVYKYGRGKKMKLRRPRKWRLGRVKRINPKGRKRSVSRRRRRNPAGLGSMGRRYFGKVRMVNAVAILAGLGGGGLLKTFLIGFMPEGPMKDWGTRLYGLASIVIGVTLQNRSRTKAIKSAGTGLVIFGIYDLLVTNTPLGRYLPTIASPALAGNYMNYGQQTYGMGASLSQGEVEVVGANIEAGVMPEIVGHDDMGLEDALEMSV